MEITNIKETQTIILPPFLQPDSAEQVKAEAMFGCNFDNEDGIKIEKTPSNTQTQNSYTKQTKDENGNKIILTYSSKDDSLISKEIIYTHNYSRIEFYKKSTTIIEKAFEKNADGKIISEETYYENAPFGIKKTKHINGQTGVTVSEEKYENGQEQPSIKIYYQKNETIELKLQDGETEETIIRRQDGTIKQHIKPIIKEQGKIYEGTVYRKDGSIYSKGTYADPNADFAIKEEKYYRNGQLASRQSSIDDRKILVEYFLQTGELKMKEIYRGIGHNLAERIIYNKDSDEYLHTVYNTEGTITSYEKGNSDDPETKFNRKLLNGEIDTSFKQGKAGTCYIAATVKSLLQTPNGQKILKETLSYDKKTKTATVTFKGANKCYSFTEQEIEKAMGRLGTGDPDFTAFLMGYEQYRAEVRKTIIDSGLGKEVMNVLTGEDGDSNILFGTFIPLDNETLDYLQNSMKESQMVITVGTPPETSENELTEEEVQAGLRNSHAYAVLNITDNAVRLYETTTGKEVEFSRETFLKKFVSYCANNLCN